MTWYGVEVKADVITYVDAPDGERNETGVTRYPHGYGETWEMYELDCDSEEKAIERAIERFKKDNREDNREIVADSITTDVLLIDDIGEMITEE